MPMKECYFRVTCLNCFSTVNFSYKDTPVTHTRVTVTVTKEFIPIVLGHYMLFENYLVLDLFEAAICKVTPNQLKGFDSDFSRKIDNNDLVGDKILVLNQYTNYFERLLYLNESWTRLSSALQLMGWVEDDSEWIPNYGEKIVDDGYDMRHHDFPTSEKTYYEIRTNELVALKHFDKWNNATRSRCFLNGHMLYITVNDLYRKCDHCQYSYPVNRKVLSERIQAFQREIFRMPEYMMATEI